MTLEFISPSYGRMDFDAVFADIVSFINQDSQADYQLIIGTDSCSRDDVCFVTAVIVHRKGKGARYYYLKRRQEKLASLRQRIFYEAALSLTVASQVAERMAHDGLANLNVEIHLDVGQQGETREFIREVVGMVAGSGFDAKIKPDSFGASKVADKHTK